MLVAQNLCNIYGMRTCVCFVVQLMYFAVVVNACKTCNRFRKKKALNICGHTISSSPFFMCMLEAAAQKKSVLAVHYSAVVQRFCAIDLLQSLHLG